MEERKKLILLVDLDVLVEHVVDIQAWNFKQNEGILQLCVWFMKVWR